MSQVTMRRASVAAGSRCLAGGLLLAGLSLAAPARAIVPEPLVIRVQDAVGAPGEQTAIVFRTYASRPIRRGRVHTLVTPVALGAGVAGSLAQTEAVAEPIERCDSVVIFSVAGDAIALPCDMPVGTQSLDAQFESLSATINAQDGVLGVLYVTLAETVTPGSEYTIDLDPGLTFLNDPEEDGVVIQPRAGTLTIRAPIAPVGLSADGGKVQPGSGALIEIGTEMPFLLQAGRIVVTYDPLIATGLPVVTADPRHGAVDLAVTHLEPGKVQIDFDSPPGSFNSVPGDLLLMRFGTLPDPLLLGTFSPITIVAGESYLLGAPGSIPLQVAWGQNPIEFILDPGIFADGFDTGDTWVWSYQP